jgi:hypothetical protein
MASNTNGVFFFGGRPRLYIVYNQCIPKCHLQGFTNKLQDEFFGYFPYFAWYTSRSA